MSEMQKLFEELKKMASSQTSVPNNPDTWSKIGQGDWAGLGFADENEMKTWISENPYANL